MSNNAYITLMTKDVFLPGVLILNESLRMVGSKYPLKCMITEGLSEETLDVLRKVGVETILVDKIPLPESIAKANMEIDPRLAMAWSDCLTKLNIFGLEGYDKLIFCDADLMILKNLDHCFEMPNLTAALDGEYEGLWPMWPHFNSGFMVLTPNTALKENILDFANKLNPYETLDFQGSRYTIADQEILNLYFCDWPEYKDLHLNKYYNVFAPHLPASKNDDVLNNAYFIHYVGQKPWSYPSPYKGTDEDNLFPYCVAYGLYKLIIKNALEPIDWSNIGTELVESIFTVSIDDLFDIFTAKYFLQFLTNHPKYVTFKNIVDNNELCLKIAPHIKSMISIAREQGDAKYSDLIYKSWFNIVDHLEDPHSRQVLLDVWKGIKDSICYFGSGKIFINENE